MVTKLLKVFITLCMSSVLAKIHMVTKHDRLVVSWYDRSVLAKIHMVTKHDLTFQVVSLWFCSSKNSYGNKTHLFHLFHFLEFCSSKNSYGNKTHIGIFNS